MAGSVTRLQSSKAPPKGPHRKFWNFISLSTHVCEQVLRYIRTASLEGPRACSYIHSIAVPSGEGEGTSRRQQDYVDSRQEVGMNADAGRLYDF